MRRSSRNGPVGCSAGLFGGVTVKACSLQSLPKRNSGPDIGSCGRAKCCRARAGIGSNYRLLIITRWMPTRILRGGTHQCARPGSGVSGFPCCGPASSAASRGRPESQPVEASRFRAGWFQLRHLSRPPCREDRKPRRLPAAKARKASPFEGMKVTPPLNGNFSSPR